MQKNSAAALPDAELYNDFWPKTFEQLKIPPNLRLILLYDKEPYRRVLPAPLKGTIKVEIAYAKMIRVDEFSIRDVAHVRQVHKGLGLHHIG